MKGMKRRWFRLTEKVGGNVGCVGGGGGGFSGVILGGGVGYSGGLGGAKEGVDGKRTAGAEGGELQHLQMRRKTR